MLLSACFDSASGLIRIFPRTKRNGPRVEISGAARKAPDLGLGAEEIGHPYLTRLMIRVVIRENACPNLDERPPPQRENLCPIAEMSPWGGGKHPYLTFVT
jgi:hypothetical protein